jgi:HAD superfamily hydrolase (TIGR01509 family)
MKKKAIIFDLDGTLIDSMALWREVDEEFLSSRGIAVPADLFDHLPAGNSFIQTAQYFKDRFQLEESLETIMQTWTDMVAEHYGAVVPLKAGAKELISRLQTADLKIGLATSNSYQLAQASLVFNGIWEHFAYVASGDVELRGKPYPDLFLLCARGLGVEPAACVAIEDTLSGVQAARAAGMYTLAIYDADSIKQHAEIKALANAFCRDYDEISQELRKLRVKI